MKLRALMPDHIKHLAGARLALALFILSACFSPSGSFDTAAQSKESGQSTAAYAVDAKRAFEHMKRMVELGPRPSGSEALAKAQQYITSELKSYGLKVSEQDFTATTPRGPVPMKNIIGELPGSRSDVVIISGHYDTKRQPNFVGANDAGSSTAAVLELARALSKTKPEYTLWFVFFDGEEAVVSWSAMNGMDNTYGSRHFVDRLGRESVLSRVKAMILLDMIGDRSLNVKRESNSTGWLSEIIWSAARRLGHGAHFVEEEHSISDDHLPFLAKGIPAIDIIDFDYGPDNEYWHTSQDRLDKVSGESVKIVCDVVIASIPAVFNRLNEMAQRKPNLK
jgi:Zn-dependent M28 family amino/carboxypeptidase